MTYHSFFNISRLYFRSKAQTLVSRHLIFHTSQNWLVFNVYGQL